MRAKSGSSFDRDLSNVISRAANIDGNGTNNMTAPQVGQAAYGIWKALNSKANKADALNQRLSEAGVDFSKFKYGDSVNNIELKVVGTSEKNSSYGYSRSSSTTYILRCEDPKTGLKYNVRLGNGKKSSLELDLIWNIFNNLNHVNQKKKDEFFQIYPQFQNFIIHVSGKILNVSEEYKVITLNYVTLNDQMNSEELNNILHNDLIKLY